MSLINILKRKIKEDLFTTPSHSQSFCIFPKFKQFYKYDISENEAYNPQVALDSAQKNAAEIYGTKSTYFLTNGSTSGVIAAVLASVQAGEKVLIWDKAHPSHANAVKLAGATPVFYELQKDENWGIYTAANPEMIEQKLKLHNSAPSPLVGEGSFSTRGTSVRKTGEGYIRAVIVTSPTYEGIVSDIKKIKEVCTKYGAYLIVDEAHGALYPFCDKLPESAISGNKFFSHSQPCATPPLSPLPQGEGMTNYFCNSAGADFVIQSLHKTAGGLNPTALLHCNLSRHCETLSCGSDKDCPPLCRTKADSMSGFERGKSPSSFDVQSALGLISTTSPSYPLLASIEKNINFLNSKKGREKILELIKNIEEMKKNVPNLEFYQGGDITKILIKHPKYTGFELSDILFEKYKIEDERANEKSVMLLCGIGTDFKKLKRLEKVLKKL